MNWRYSHDSEKDLISVYADEEVTAIELKTGAGIITSIPQFHSDIRVLLNFLHATKITVQADDLASLANHPDFSARSKRAVVVPHGFSRAIFEFYAHCATLSQIRVFSRVEHAMAWLLAEQE